jgi:gliding motility-associated-like protein
MFHLSYAQVCSTLGQTPQTAFPVCGTDTFSQKSVPLCRTGNISTGCNDGADYGDKNPFWYRFTCFSSGTLGFQIKPNTETDDYDWELFDITGVQNLSLVFGSISLMKSNNWSSNPGSTGTSAGHNNSTSCAGPSYPNQSAMPELTEGHTYLLLVSHFTDTQDGYSLYFQGGTASITDPLPPDIVSAQAPCDGTLLTVKLNKKMQCSSLAPDGSDFTINYPGSSVTGATGIGCSSSFDMDSVVVTLNNPLPAGNYILSIKTGSDNNTLLDNCNTPIPEGNNTGVVVYPLSPSLMDNITPLVNCLPDSLLLIFQKPIQCSSVAADGSDFVITGPSVITIANAKGYCNGGNELSDTIRVNFTAPVFTGGTYQLQLVKGSDGNTLLNECNQETPVNSVLSFNVKQAVSARFNYKVSYGCKYDTVYYSHDGADGVNQWLWTLDNNLTRSSENDTIIYTTFEPRQIELLVSNGSCSDSSFVTLSFPQNDTLKAAFTAPDFICPNDTASFTDFSTGKIVSWNWDFSNGQTSSLQNPPAQVYPSSGNTKEYPVRLSVKNEAGCADTTYRILQVAPNCYIAVPSAFTPNGDGKNDYLYPLNAYTARDLEFRVYNRYGQLIFETKDWTQKWDGTFKGLPQPSGVYIWTLNYTDATSGKKNSLKGTSVLIR